MFGFGKAKLRGELTVACALANSRGDKVLELSDELVAKDARVAELEAEVKNLTAESKGHAAANRLNRQLRFEAQTEAKLMREKLAAAEAALQKIADMVTPGSAPIGKRMAKVAADHLAGAAGVQAEAA